ncbi:MAG: hypothetical protein AAGJ46_12225 [Planctomycetota bacterium]
MVFALGWAGLKYGQHRARVIAEQRKAELRERAVDRIKGKPGYAVIWDAETLAMLANDPDCVANATGARFSMMDCSDPRLGRISDLANVKTLTFYSCNNVEGVLAAAEAMPAVEMVFFEATDVDAASVDRFVNWPSLSTVVFDGRQSEQHVARLSELAPAIDAMTAEEHWYGDPAANQD